MNWKIIFLWACFNVFVKATEINQHFPEEECLEELYDVEILLSLNVLPTLCKADLNFDEDDIRLLSTECYPDEELLNKKKVSVKKYQQKMQALQCIDGLYVLKLLDELKAIFRESIVLNLPIGHLKGKLQEPVSRHRGYLKSMLSLLNVAKWDAYGWQIETFTFVEGLAASNTNLDYYKDHFLNNNDRMRDNVLAIVNQCVQYTYLSCPGGNIITSKARTISGLDDRVDPQMAVLHDSGVLDAHKRPEYFTVPNLMLKHLYFKDDFIFDWSVYGFETSDIKRQSISYAGVYKEQQSYHQWELDPIGGNKYNSLISKCIHLRLIYSVWVHLYAYLAVLTRPSDVNVRETTGKESLSKLWKTLVDPVKRALRLFGLTKNIYWSAISLMTFDFKNISKGDLGAREEFTRRYFCRTAQDLGLGSSSDIDRQLTNLKVPEDHKLTYDSIEANVKLVESYTVSIVLALMPVDGTFIRTIVSAEGNETFVML